MATTKPKSHIPAPAALKQGQASRHDMPKTVADNPPMPTKPATMDNCQAKCGMKG